MNSQKRIAAELLKSGTSRIRIRQSKEVDEALTRDDVRNLIRKGYIWKEQKKGTSKFNVKKKVKQKQRGRMKGFGSRKGKRGARKPRKDTWIETVRPQRKMLSELKEAGKLENSDFRKIYLMIKGGTFRSKKHLLFYLKDHEMLREGKKGVKKSDIRKKHTKKQEIKRGKQEKVKKTRKRTSQRKAEGNQADKGKPGRSKGKRK